MAKRIIQAVVLGILGLVVVIAMQPDDFRVARSTTIAAPRERVFSLVNDFHAFNTWNPYAKKDPTMEQSYDGPPAGVGSVYRWSGNQEIGAGSMTITGSRPSELVEIDLAFTRPFEANNDVAFTFEPAGEGTRVTWAMTGEMNFIAKAMHLVMDMDAMVGTDFEKGLADMKAIAERAPAS